MGLLDQVRVQSKRVSDRAKFVHIDTDRIPAYAASLPKDRLGSPDVDPGCHYLGHGCGTVAFFLTLNTVNFGSGYFPHLNKRPGMSGYFTVASSLNDYFNANGPLCAEELAEMSPHACSRLFGQDPEKKPIREMMQLFAAALRDLGLYLLNRFEGQFGALVETAGGSAEHLVALLSEMPYFNDVEPYEELQVPFFKRAQITAANLSLAFGAQGPGRFHDLHRLTMFADNLVPHVLRVDKVLRYDPALISRINRFELIPARSPEEVELRACAVHAVELLVSELGASGHRLTAMEADNLLWNRGQQPAYKAFPRHRTRTVFY